MPIGIAFWILMLLWLVLDVWRAWPNMALMGSSIILFLLIGILGWHSFGSPIR